MSSSAEEKVLTLKSRDGEEFTVRESVAAQSVMIKNMIEDGCAEAAIPLTNVDSNTLAMVLEYLNKHGDSGVSDEDKKNFDSEFVKKELNDLVDLTLASNYMEIKNLLDLLCQSIAGLIKDREVEEVRNMFGIKNDFTPEEEEAIQREHSWAFE